MTQGLWATHRNWKRQGNIPRKGHSWPVLSSPPTEHAPGFWKCKIMIPCVLSQCAVICHSNSEQEIQTTRQKISGDRELKTINQRDLVSTDTPHTAVVYTLFPGARGKHRKDPVVGWSVIPYTKRLWVRFPVRDMPRLRFPALVEAHTGGNQSMFQSHINVSLSVPFLSLKAMKKNVLRWGFKKKRKENTRKLTIS